MNKLDKFDVDLEIFFDKHLLRMNNEKLLDTLLTALPSSRDNLLSVKVGT